ncbi:hypothetical protein E4634_20510 [Mangrovimicrobium sediminis]|uniref:Cadmium carbonic anhydrase n=1 Tax=Mangrovimicrobium sediminis TaxID=2562682 RepID=A0A4Z0LUQ5_9GAMM|nr:delta-class carbonic anhydrase [Haliea sp. SAOS-164]TGD70984.1 hypothetical protein E4634_20510 [Haliea sp. SAOS-164]
MNIRLIPLVTLTALATVSAWAGETSHHADAGHATLEQQRHTLAENTRGKGYGPQSPRDIDAHAGLNKRAFNNAPPADEMNLCNIHFHKNAEHRGGEFSTYAGDGDGFGYGSGYVFSGELPAAKLAAVDTEICPSEHGGLAPGDTIEVHFVHSTADVKPGATLGACVNEAINNPQLRVEARVFVLVNDDSAPDFAEVAGYGKRKRLYQALNMPTAGDKAVEYAGSTTGPGYNEKGSPYQVTWRVAPAVTELNIASVGKWCQGNDFAEDHAHGVRNLVTNPELLSSIE